MSQLQETTVAVPLPTFRQPIQDPALPVAPAPTASPPASPPPEPTGESPDERPPAMPAPEGRTGTSWVGRSHGAGDPVQAGRVLVGLLAILLGSAGAVLYRAGRHLRQPTKEQLHGVAMPLGRVMVRYLPLEFVSKTLVDVTEAAAAAHDYVLDGPMVTRVPMAREDE